MNTYRDIATALSNANTIVITTHVRPDGDAIGSCLGLHRLLKNAGKNPVILDLAPLPERYQFLVKEGDCLSSQSFDFSSVDCIVVLDAGAVDRAPPFVEARAARLPVINVDHHVSNTQFGRLNVVDADACSVGEMLCAFAQAAGYTLTPEIAAPLWVAIVTDTGRFSYSNTTPRTLETAATLLRTGIDTAMLNHNIYDIMPLRKLKLQTRALQQLSTHENDCVAMVSLTREDYAALNCSPADAEDIVNLPRSIEGVGIAVFLYELPDLSETKVSLRTAEPYDAAVFCRQLGGGGHARAAGCALPLPLDAARKETLKHIHNQWFAI